MTWKQQLKSILVNKNFRDNWLITWENKLDSKEFSACPETCLWSYKPDHQQLRRLYLAGLQGKLSSTLVSEEGAARTQKPLAGHALGCNGFHGPGFPFGGLSMGSSGRGLHFLWREVEQEGVSTFCYMTSWSHYHSKWSQTCYHSWLGLS